MPDTTRDIKKWMATWRQAASALTQLKKKELQAVDYYEKNRRILDEMLQYACQHRQERLSSGLVEQQRWFMKLRDRESAAR